MTTISNKKQINKGVKSMTAKAMSWNQVCKQISGIGGYIEIGNGEKVRPIELMQSLGVHVSKNSYKVSDIFAAWNERMKRGKQVLMSHAVPYCIDVMGYSYRLCAKSTKEEGKFVGVSMKQLCPLVSASDKDTNTVTVNAANVLKGLQQSLFVDATLDAIKKSEIRCASIREGYINLNVINKKAPAQWVRVSKDKDGVWTIVPEKAAEATSAERVAKSAKEVAKSAKEEAKGAKSAKKGATSVTSKSLEMIKNALEDYNMGFINEEEYNSILAEAIKVA